MSNNKRKPLRSTTELAEEFGVSVKRLSGVLGGYDGPKAILKNRNASFGNAWFDPVEMRTWWNSLPVEVRER